MFCNGNIDDVSLDCSFLSFWIFEMQIACKNYPDDPEAQGAIDLLYDTALMSSGFTVSTEYHKQLIS